MYVLYFVPLFRLCLHEIATITTECTEKRHECADFAVNPGETSGISPAGGTDLSGVGAFAPSRVCPSGCSPALSRVPDWLLSGFSRVPDWLLSGFSRVPDWLLSGFSRVPDWLLSGPLPAASRCRWSNQSRFPAFFGSKSQRHLARTPRSQILSGRCHVLCYLYHSLRSRRWPAWPAGPDSSMAPARWPGSPDGPARPQQRGPRPPRSPARQSTSADTFGAATGRGVGGGGAERATSSYKYVSAGTAKGASRFTRRHSPGINV